MRRVMLAVTASVGLAGCGKKDADDPAPGGPPPVKVDDRNTNFRPGAGAVQNVRQAARRTNALVEMKTLGDLVTIMYTEDGRMPSKEQIAASVKRDAPAVAKGIDEGVYILTGATDHAGLWAYEVDADKAGGIVLVAGVANRATAEEVQQHLAKLPKTATAPGVPKAPPGAGGGRVGLVAPPAEVSGPRRDQVAIAPTPRPKTAEPAGPTSPLAGEVAVLPEGGRRVGGGRPDRPEADPPPGPSRRDSPTSPAGGEVTKDARPARKPEPEPAPDAEPEVPAVAVSPRDLEDIRLFIDGASLVSGRMPTKEQTRAALRAAGSPAAELVKSKAIVLTGATSREAVWAYEAAAPARGGLVAGPNGVETLTAEELARRLETQ